MQSTRMYPACCLVVPSTFFISPNKKTMDGRKIVDFHCTAFQHTLVERQICEDRQLHFVLYGRSVKASFFIQKYPSPQRLMNIEQHGLTFSQRNKCYTLKYLMEYEGICQKMKTHRSCKKCVVSPN